MRYSTDRRYDPTPGVYSDYGGYDSILRAQKLTWQPIDLNELQTTDSDLRWVTGEAGQGYWEERVPDANPWIPGWQSESSNPVEWVTGGAWEYEDTNLYNNGWSGVAGDIVDPVVDAAKDIAPFAGIGALAVIAVVAIVVLK